MTAPQYLRSLGMEYVPAKHEVECTWCHGHGYWIDRDDQEFECDVCGGLGAVGIEEDEA